MAKKIIIDAGHGGVDSGATANNIIEKNITLDISKYIKQRLDELGIDSTLTREDDTTLEPNKRIQRIKDISNLDKDAIIISNHINAGGGDGAEVIYALRNNDELPKLILNELARKGQNSRKAYQKVLPSNPSKDYYYILRETPNAQSIIIEYGFLDSKNNDEINMLKNNWKEFAEGVVKALATYLNVPYNMDVGYYYTVQKGDTLWSIARKFNLTVDKLKEINNLNNNIISIGQRLVVSESVPKNNSYMVKKGDTLYSISKKYNLGVDELKSINNLNSDTLSIGQILKVEKEEEPKVYIVEKGDSLYSISRKFNVAVSELANINNLSTTILSIGQKLLIP